MTTTAAETTTQGMWAERVRAWKASGQSARQFAKGRGFSVSALRYWSKRLSRIDTPRLLRLVSKPAASAAAAARSEVVVEVGAARVCVTCGFDAALLADAVRALGGGTR